jgi:hypothetical protein
MKLAILYLLFVVDAACSGYRAAAGRNALIRKWPYFRQAMLYGVVVGHAFLVSAGVLFLAVHGTVFDRTVETASDALLLVYLPYAVVIAAATALRFSPSVDLKSIASVVIFGPLTFLRPPVAVLGLFLATSWSRSAAVGAIGLGFVAAMLLLEQVHVRLIRLEHGGEGR